MASSSSNPFGTSSTGSKSGSQFVEYRPQPSELTPRSPQSRSGATTPSAYEDSRLLQTPSSPSTHETAFRTTRPSPLNPASPPAASSFNRNPHSSSTASMSSRPVSRSSSTHPFVSKQHSDDPFSPSTISGLGLGGVSGLPASIGQRGSMVLYRFADDPSSTRDSLLQPPRFGAAVRDSIGSSSGDSVISFSSDSKYPSGIPAPRGLVPYAYDPLTEENGPPDEVDYLHDPNEKGAFRGDKGAFPWRGIMNVTVMVALILGLLCLFVFYPVMTFYRNAARNNVIDGNIRINATGQAPVLFQMPEIIDPETPQEARTRTGFDGKAYELVFSDEFNTPGRTFYPGDDPFWEAADLWYHATGDLEWYDPQQVTTRDGHLVITIDSTSTTQAGLTSGSTAPFTAAENHNLDYRSGMIQTWNKFCFSSGYIEVSVTFPGPDENTAGYWPGAWTMGNLARPGYPATTDGMWPYTYDSCDIGTFPNQTNPDKQTPAVAAHSDASRELYNYELSWLSGQRLSACSCPGSDHPGPSVNKGRGSPEIDVFEASKDKQNTIGGTVSQSCQFAPFTHDYLYQNDTLDKWQNFNSSRTRANTYHGSAVQQSVSGVTKLPSDMFQGSGQNFKTFGFEYWSDPNNRPDGYVMWQVDGQPTHRLSAQAVGPDPEPTGTGVGQRLVPEEPMSIVLNLGMSRSWQTIDLSTMQFPGEMLVDYVRVYQRKDSVNVGCNPKDYPTADYINNHLDAYMDPNLTTWKWPIPKNSLYEGGC